MSRSVRPPFHVPDRDPPIKPAREEVVALRQHSRRAPERGGTTVPIQQRVDGPLVTPFSGGYLARDNGLQHCGAEVRPGERSNGEHSSVDHAPACQGVGT